MIIHTLGMWIKISKSEQWMVYPLVNVYILHHFAMENHHF